MSPRYFNILHISALTIALVTLTGLVRADNNDDPLPDIDDYSREVDSSETTTIGPNIPNNPNRIATYISHGYTFKTKGFFNVTLHTSPDDGLLVFQGTIGNGGRIRREETVEEVLFEIIHSEDSPVDQNVNRPHKKQWILVRPPGDVDVAVIHWERNGDGILISGPLPFTDLGSSEATNSTEVWPPVID